jgi:hypothetical protein
VPSWQELIVKTQTRKESDFEMHQLMGREEIIERPELSQDALKPGEGSKLSPMRYGDNTQLSTNTRSPRGLEPTPVFEKHYSVRELANLWNLSDRTIRRMFVGEPGVVEWGACERRMKRAYKTLRIPESVARRVHRRLRKAS